MTPERSAGAAAPAVRLAFAGAAAAALTVTIVFVVFGDGVDVPEAEGARSFLVEAGHALAWALLTVGFGLAAVRGRWTRVSNIATAAAGVTYGLFLFAVLLWP